MISGTMKNAVAGLAVLAAMALAGCATTESASGQQSAEWVGKDTAALVAEWGTTDDKKTQSDGSEVWVYHKTKESTIGGQLPASTTRKERTETYEVNGVTMTRQVAYEETSYDPHTLVAAKCTASFTIRNGLVTTAEFKGSCK